MSLPTKKDGDDEPVLELVVVRSTQRAGQLSLRCADDLDHGGLVTTRLVGAGFRAGDRVQLRRRAQ